MVGVAKHHGGVFQHLGQLSEVRTQFLVCENVLQRKRRHLQKPIMDSLPIYLCEEPRLSYLNLKLRQIFSHDFVVGPVSAS